MFEELCCFSVFVKVLIMMITARSACDLHVTVSLFVLFHLFFLIKKWPYIYFKHSDVQQLFDYPVETSLFKLVDTSSPLLDLAEDLVHVILLLQITVEVPCLPRLRQREKSLNIFLWSWLECVYCCWITVKMMKANCLFCCPSNPSLMQSIMVHLWIFLKAVFLSFFFLSQIFFALLIFSPADDSCDPIWCLMPAADVFYNSSKSVSLPFPSLPFSSLPFSLFLPDKFWYCRLSPNHKVLHYGDLEESPQGEVPHDSLQDKRECQVKVLQGFTQCFYCTFYDS